MTLSIRLSVVSDPIILIPPSSGGPSQNSHVFGAMEKPNVLLLRPPVLSDARRARAKRPQGDLATRAHAKLVTDIHAQLIHLPNGESLAAI